MDVENASVLALVGKRDVAAITHPLTERRVVM
jgi:hypothetical protein